MNGTGDDFLTWLAGEAFAAEPRLRGDAKVARFVAAARAALVADPPVDLRADVRGKLLRLRSGKLVALGAGPMPVSTGYPVFDAAAVAVTGGMGGGYVAPADAQPVFGRKP
jgi:hypothetical protein